LNSQHAGIFNSARIDMPHDTLHPLLDANLRLPAEYASGLTNHLPMALHALDRMGASAPQMRRFFDGYAARFERPGPAAAAVPPLADWVSHRGRYESLAALQSTFADALRRDDPPTVLRRVVPQLMPGVGAAAFHGLLRTAHAFEGGHLGELAHGLAYWAARWFALAPVPVQSPRLDFDSWATRLTHDASGWASDAALISQRMQHAEQAPAYRALAGRLALGDDTLARLSAFAATAYAESGNFTVLHLVTGCHAARVLLPFAGETLPALGSVLRAVTAAYLASGVAGTRRAPPPAPAQWPALVAGALRAGDEHVIKLVDACIAEASLCGDAPYRQAATRGLA
jgi:hypothetical protein